TVTGLSVPPGLEAGTFGLTLQTPCGSVTLPDAFTVIVQVTLTVQADPEIHAPIAGSHPGTTAYDIILIPPAPVTLTAPYQHDDLFFLRWKDAAGTTLSYPATLALTVTADSTVLAEYAPVTEFYVAETGDDANPGTSPEAPMRHIQALLDRYPAIGEGCTVHVGPGTYPENLSIDPGHEGLLIEGAGDGADPAANTHVIGQGGPLNTDAIRVRCGAGPGGTPTTLRALRVSSPDGSTIGEDAPCYGGVAVVAEAALAKNGSGGAVDGVCLSELTVTGIAGDGLGCGILLTGVSPWTSLLRNVTIEGCHLLSNDGPGMMLANTRVEGLDIRGGTGGRATVMAHNGGPGLLLSGELEGPAKAAGQFAPFALHNTTFWDNAGYHIELVCADTDIDALDQVAFVGCTTLAEIEDTIWHEVDDLTLGLVTFGMPDFGGNCLTWCPTSCDATFGGVPLPLGMGWYGLSYPAGAQVQIEVLGRDASVCATIRAFDVTGGEHDDALPVVCGNQLSVRWYLRYGAIYRVSESSVLQGTIVGAYYDVAKDVTTVGRTVLPGCWVFGHTFVDCHVIQGEMLEQ
ncbi:MAG: hypothetical protein JXR77_12355, partial [Lentisphaeria bacterium]|nr:hypothetical protein [Lentisphaeria bacterium]